MSMGTSKRLVALLLVGLVVWLSESALAQPRPVPAKRDLTFASVAELRNTDPHNVFGLHEMIALKQIWDPLVEIDDAGKFQPVLATRWSVSPDQRTWTFTLRSGVRFADGKPFTAEAVKATLERIIKNPRSGYNFLFKDVEAIVASGDRVQITTRQPDGAFLYNMTTVFITPQESGEVIDRPYEGKVGTGPFTLQEWVKGQRMVMVKNPNYWRQGFPKLDRLIIRPIPEEPTKVAALRAGEVDIANALSLESYRSRQRDPNFQVMKHPLWQATYLSVNVTRKPLDDPRVRQAINMAINREVIIKFILGVGLPLATYPPRGLTGYDASLPPNPFNLAMAKGLVKEALPQGYSGTIRILTSPGKYVKSEDISLYIIAQLGEIGLKGELQTLESAAQDQALRSGNYDLAYLSSIAVTGDPSRFFIQRILDDFHKTGYRSERAFDLIRRAARETDQAKQGALYKELQAVLKQDLPHMYLFQDEWLYGFRKGIQNFKPRSHRLKDFYMVEWVQ